jgi:hypothetical protein
MYFFFTVTMEYFINYSSYVFKRNDWKTMPGLFTRQSVQGRKIEKCWSCYVTQQYVLISDYNVRPHNTG